MSSRIGTSEACLPLFHWKSSFNWPPQFPLPLIAESPVSSDRWSNVWTDPSLCLVQEVLFEWGLNESTGKPTKNVNKKISLPSYKFLVHMVPFWITPSLIELNLKNLLRTPSTARAPTPALSSRSTWWGGWRAPSSPPSPPPFSLSSSPTSPSSSLLMSWSSEPPSSCSCSWQCEPQSQIWTSQIPNLNLRSALISAHRALLPPISYLTLLDIGLVVNLGLVALCLLLVAASAVSIIVTWTFSFFTHTMMTPMFPVPEKERTPRLGRETGAGDFCFSWKTTWTHP